MLKYIGLTDHKIKKIFIFRSIYLCIWIFFCNFAAKFIVMAKEKFKDMPMPSFDEIIKWWKAAIGLKVHQHIISIADFYFHPAIFWKRYDKLPRKDKAIQLGTYVALFVLILLCCGVVSNVPEGIKAVMMELLRLSIFFVSIVLALVVATFKSIRRKIIGKGVIFGIYLYLLFIPYQLIFLLIFRHSESYLFYAFAILVSIVIDAYIMVVPCIAFLMKRRDKWIYVLAWITIVSIFDFFYLKYEVRETNWVYRDVIAQERFERGKSLHTAYRIPTMVVTTTDQSVTRYLFSSPVDTIAMADANYLEYFEQLQADIDTLQSIIPQMEYTINQDFFNYTLLLKKSILFVYKNKTYRFNQVLKRANTEYGLAEWCAFSEECNEANNNLFETELKYVEKFERARSVGCIRILYRPYLLWTFINERYIKRDVQKDE